MKDAKGDSVFLARASYRRRRVRDLAMLLPILGVLLWFIPLLWSDKPQEAPQSGIILSYVFGVWIFLIIVTALVSALLRSSAEGAIEEDVD